VPPPPLQPGPTLATADLPGLLLSVDEVETVLSRQDNTAWESNLTEAAPRSTLDTSPGTQGSVTPVTGYAKYTLSPTSIPVSRTTTTAGQSPYFGTGADRVDDMWTIKVGPTRKARHNGRPRRSS
jgi:hypothetical protein